MVIVLHDIGESSRDVSGPKPSSEQKKPMGKAYCAYCQSGEHYLSQCSEVAELSKEQLKESIQVNKWCWRCAPNQQAVQCT